jgi:putative ABC transport system ATP-binding protein
MPLIELHNVSKNYYLGETTVHALRGVDLAIDRGEFAAVWGPSGSGKTTLLNLIGIIDKPTSGKIMFDDHEVIALSDNQKADLRNRAVGFIFQQFNLIPVLTALENVMLPLQIRGISARQAKERALFRLAQVELADYPAHRPDELSGGQQQRVAIARALVTGPKLVVADEPTANLDSKTAMKILNLMRDLNRKEDTTFLFSTHDQRLLSNINRRIYLQDGIIQEDQ